MSLCLSTSDLHNMDQEEIYALYTGLANDKELFAKVIMGHIVKEVPPYQREIYKALGDPRIKNLCVIVYRGGAKSTLGHTIDTTHDICTMKSPFTLFISETVDQASADLISVQDELESNDLIKSLYGSLAGNVWNKESMEAANGCYVMCRGTGSKIRGLKWKNQRPTKIKLDDTESESNTMTEKQRKTYTNWLFTNILRAGMPKETYIQFFGTIVHPKAFLAEAKNMPMFKGHDGFYLEVPVESNGIPAWPSMYSMEWIKDEREQYRRHNKLPLFMQEMYHIPHTDGKANLNVAMITEMGAKYMNTAGINYLMHGDKKIPINVYMGVDPADTENESSDDTVITTIGVMPSKAGYGLKQIVILDIRNVKYTPSKVVAEICDACQAFSPKLITFETQGGRAAYIDLLRLEMKRRGRFYGIMPFKSNQSKTNKWLNGLEPYINQGHVSYLPSTANINVLTSQLESYNSETRDHDDTVDGLFLAIENSVAPQEYNVDEAIRRNLNKKDEKPRVANWYTI